ncbi:hypothetical protein M011DRAFT_480494 [Sporormia fimetaria CBS 119925]|uniref:C2H2-type domain-containing protein n=1 Tax=Sporormia fimetaria CBS 119925 TaxID=1340428 RepID=A0A6A6V2D7_9PLEO|nr:hypothetical protein M011DRAFT_480494 [Sporormia fimetaria CBS 119925]
MSDHSETTPNPLTSNIQHQGPAPHTSSSSTPLQPNTASHSDNNDRVGSTKSSTASPSRRSQGFRKEASIGPHAASTRAVMQRPTSPSNMTPDLSAVQYTRTGRISKAKKGKKVHDCLECGKSYTRAEHLRRHQKNHAQQALVCKFADCGKTFYRPDLLQRHEERHSEIEQGTRRASFISQTSAPDTGRRMSGPLQPPPIITTFAQQPSNYYPTVAPLPEATTPPSNPKQRSYLAHNPSVSIPVAVEGGFNGHAFSDSFNHSPIYSSSSGYASPMTSAGDYSNMFANPPYGAGPNRTRTPSNASFNEPWHYPSCSPTSATSTVAFTWTANDKMGQHGLPYMNATSYPLASMPMPAGADPLSAYGQYCQKTMAQRDEEEQALLFPEQPFGMGQMADTFSYEQFLNNFWRLFHPSIPLIHRPTFDPVSASPLLRAAMIAIGAQYSNDPRDKCKAGILHDRCMQLLEKRELEGVMESGRLCDSQAIVLLEYLSQYRARRWTKTLSPRFLHLYTRLSKDAGVLNASAVNIMSSLLQPETATYELWSQWVGVAIQQRLLACCYILEYQQAVLLARPHSPHGSAIEQSLYDLPFPCHHSSWEAQDPLDWAFSVQQNAQTPTHLFDVPHNMSVGTLDRHQSLLLIAAQYNHFNNPAVYLSPPVLPDIEPFLEPSSETKHALLTARLLQVTPLRALLAVSGESWILSEKVTSAPSVQTYRSTLRAWVAGLWATTSDPQSQSATQALRLSIELLQHAMVHPNDLALEFGAELALHYAAMVIWAVTVASYARIQASQAPKQRIRFQSGSPRHGRANPTFPAMASTSLYPATAGPTSVPCSDFTNAAISFLAAASNEVDSMVLGNPWPQDLSQWQHGCTSLMLWVKMRLRSGVEGRSVVATGPTSASVGTGRGADDSGEVLESVITALERILSRGWEGLVF